MKGNKPNQSKLTKKHQQIINSYCDVCFGYFRKVPAKHINEHLQILLCTKCNCKVHKCCYDFLPNETYISQNLREFICNKCSHDEYSKKPCFVCHGQQGAMKMTEQNQAVHVFCALYHSQIQILSYYPQIKFKKSMLYSQSQKLCEICSKSNAFQKCAMEECHRIAHPYCAKKRFIQQEQTSDDPKCWNLHLGDGPNGMFDLAEQLIPFLLFKQQVQQQLTEVQQQGQIFNHNKQEILKQVYQTYFNDVKKKKRSSKKLKRGGFSFISCPLHQYTPHCSCAGAGQGDSMIQCQCCLAWFHNSCIKGVPLSESQPFICSKCNSFYDLKKKMIDEITQGKSDTYEIKCDMPIKNNYMDYMWFLRVIDCRIAKGSAAKMFKQLQKYPLKSSKMNSLIKIQCRDKVELLCENFYRDLFCEEEQLKKYKPLIVLRVNQQQKVQTIEQNVIKNKLLRKWIKNIREFLKKQGIQDPFGKLQKQYDFKEAAISDQYEKIIELAKSQQRYQEVAILKIKAQAYSFLQIVKKVNTGTTIITFNELQQSLQKAQKIEHIPQYLIKPLKDKYQQVKDLVQSIVKTIVGNPNEQQKIQEEVGRLQILNVSPPEIYLAYKQQKSLINKLYIFCLKQSGNKIQEQLQITDKIDLLRNVNSIVSNHQLVGIINQFNSNKQKINYKPLIFKGVKEVLQFFQKQQVIFQLKDKINKKTCKAQKLKTLLHKVKYYNIFEAQFNQIIQNWNQIVSLMKESVLCSLSAADNIMDITSMREKCLSAISLLQMYPIQVQNDHSFKFTTWLKLAQNRKQQLQQLLTLCTQSQLKKNPLSIQKIIPTISKDNKLLKQFYYLKKQQLGLKQKFMFYLGKSSQKTEFFKRQAAKKLSRKQQLKQNSQKPSLNQINEFIQTLKNKKVDFKQQTQELKRILNICIQISSKVRKYCQQKKQFQTCLSISQLSQNRKEIEELRKKVLCYAGYNLQAQLIELYHLQIYNRMKSTVLSLNTSLDIDKIGKLLKFAEEESLINCQSYKKLKEKHDSKSQKTKEFALIKNIQNQLNLQAAKDIDPLYKNLFALRRTLSIPDLNMETSKILYIEQTKQKNRQSRSKIEKLLKKNVNKANFNEAKSVFLQGLKSPFAIPQILRLNTQLQKCNQLLRRWKDLSKNSNYRNLILTQYENLHFKIDQMELAKRQFKQNEQYLGKISLLCLKQDQESKYSIQQTMNKLEENIIGKDNDIIYEAKKKFIQFWHKYLSNLRETKSQYVSYQKLKRILYDCYYCLQNDLRRGGSGDQFQLIIEYLQKIFFKIKKQVQTQNYQKSNIVDGYIDIDQLIYMLNSGTDIDDEFNIFRPYEDLSKFRFKNLNKIQTKSKQQIYKRQRPEEQLSKKQSQRSIQAKIQEYQQQQNDQSQNQNSGVVTDKSRKKIKQILLKNIRKNPQLKKYGDCQNQVKMIQNQVFGQFHNDVLKYFQATQKFEKLFIKLQQCPNISQKLIKKEFDFKFIKLLVQNLSNITQFENIMVVKIKQQEKQKKIHKITEQTEQNNQSKRKNVLQMLASGKVDQTYRKQIKKQIKMIKENKHKKKKHKHRRSRSNSRSKSPQAQFSSESEQQNQIPSYIKNQYSQGLKQKLQKTYDFSQFLENKEKQAPLMFDPDQEQVAKQNLQVQYPKGSVLKIKSIQLEMYLKKKGKVQINANFFTDEDYRKIKVQLVDPGCNKLNIRKQKNDKEIIQYLNKPNRKKYKYLVGWIEANNQDDNTCLRDLSLEANERHKIFGWQSQLIKIHIMSIKQFVQINKLGSTPSQVTSQASAKLFDSERMIFIIQYPLDKMFELKEKHSPFKDVQRVIQPHKVSIPLPTYEAMDLQNPFGYFQPAIMNKQSITIKPLNYQDPVAKSVQFQGWGNINTDTQSNKGNSKSSKIDMNNPFQIIRNKLGFGYFQQIQSDEQNNVIQHKNDLVSNLLKSVNQPHIHSSNMPQNLPISNLPPYSQIRSQQGYQGQNQAFNRYPPYQNQRYVQPTNPNYQSWNNAQLPRYQPYNKPSTYTNNSGYGQYNSSYQNPNIGRNPMMQNSNQRRNPMFGQIPANNQVYNNQNPATQSGNNYGNQGLNNQNNGRGNNMGEGDYQSRYNNYK